MSATTLVVLCLTLAGPPAGEEIEEKALAFLRREVPRWSKENRCFSCHNNADGARALYLAASGSKPAGPDPLAETTAWLARPGGWKHNGGEGPFSDKRLARIEFSAALAEAVRAGALKDPTPLKEAAKELVGDQAEDGSWAPEGPDAIGSPATLGRPLATMTALETLRTADAARFREAIARGERWLARLEPVTMLDASVVLLTAPIADPRRKLAIDRIRAAQTDAGGWGPYPDSPPEPFDTAVVLIALSTAKVEAAAIAKARLYLTKTQQEDGGWIETTRPAGAESYAQRISTAGWVARALMASRPPRAPASR